MFTMHLRRAGVALAAVLAAGAFTAVAPAGKDSPGAAPLHIQATFNSVLVAPQDQPPDCPASQGFLLVRGQGTGSGNHISSHAPGTAEECSLPTGDIFDVHGKGTYTTPDGSVLYLVYHEQSENPFAQPPGIPPDPTFVLHDNGQWDVDPDLSTGRFHGATGHGTITAEVPIFCDQFFNCTATVHASYDGTITFAGD